MLPFLPLDGNRPYNQRSTRSACRPRMVSTSVSRVRFPLTNLRWRCTGGIGARISRRIRLSLHSSPLMGTIWSNIRRRSFGVHRVNWIRSRLPSRRRTRRKRIPLERQVLLVVGCVCLVMRRAKHCGTERCSSLKMRVFYRGGN